MVNEGKRSKDTRVSSMKRVGVSLVLICLPLCASALLADIGQTSMTLKGGFVGNLVDSVSDMKSNS